MPGESAWPDRTNGGSTVATEDIEGKIPSGTSGSIAARETVAVDITAQALGTDRHRAAQLLSRWIAQGWLQRVGHRLYVPVPLDLAGNEQIVADPWVLVPTLFGQCYIGGWTAAHALFARPHVAE